MAVYPERRQADVALRDGSTVRVRPVRAEDRDALRAFFAELSEESRAFRFFSGAVNVDWAADWAVDVDYAQTYGLVATSGQNGHVVAHGSYVAGQAGRAEVAFAIADELQGQGLGTILLAHLAEAAADNGIGLFEA